MTRRAAIAFVVALAACASPDPFAEGQNAYARGDLPAAARWYRQAADAGHRDSARRLGVMYAYGRGVPVDYFEAVRLLGPPTGEMKQGVRKYSPVEQAEIEAWMLALSYRMQWHSVELKRAFSDGAHVSVVLHAKDSTIAIESAQAASDRVRGAVIETAKEALADAPPTPAAARSGATAHFDFDFRYKD